MKLWYVETGAGCGIVQARTEQAAYAEALADVGRNLGVSRVREATSDDVAWVRAMGGRIPCDGGE